ncbi:pyridoxine 5'-phosphate synthase [Gammaproteobacteria bacterium LSUCC0112]|nr:pyridoxine 5'-phosphate synthase [Gammaproteobacteria bacterium LSUCC0112]
MTLLSVNVNKIALLRNSRGTNFPDLLVFVRRILAQGVRGITIHPRPDERHITRRDAVELTTLLRDYPDVEFNIEGYPSSEFLELIRTLRPAQCTLVPDEPGQLTSDHGWDVRAHEAQLSRIVSQLREWGVRSSLFLDPDPAQIAAVKRVGADRIELYTEEYARAFAGGDLEQCSEVLSRYQQTAVAATHAGIGVNAGHDLNLKNLATFLGIGDIIEVSIGHALIVESLEMGMDDVLALYLAITGDFAGDEHAS